MRVQDCLLYLFGNADAARRIAHSQTALLTGLLLVFTAAIARRYDALYLPASWTWWAGPIIVSVLSSLLVFIFVRRILRLRKAPSRLGQYATFLGLFWMTAPCAWLYALPFEAHLDSLAAAQANLALVALVAVWRVAILTRAMQAITEAPFSLCLIAILFPAALEAAALALSAPVSNTTLPLAAMGGIRLIDPSEVFLHSAHVVVFYVSLILLIGLRLCYVRIRRKSSFDSAPFPVPSHGPVFSSPFFVALAALGVWIGVSIPSQTRQRGLHHAESLADQSDWAGLSSYLQTLAPQQLPTPLQLPPDVYSWWGLNGLGKLLEALPDSPPIWIGETYRKHASTAFQHLETRSISVHRMEPIAALLTHGPKLPRFPQLLDDRAPELQGILSKVCDPAHTFQYYGDHSELLNLYLLDGSTVPIRYPILWEPRRKLILYGMEQAMGSLPKRVGLPPFDPEIVETLELERCRRLTLRLTFRLNFENDDRNTVYLYLPRSHETDSPPRRLPAVLALHPTHPLGKGVVDGQSEEPNRAYGRELADRGYIVLAPDYPSFGDSKDYDFKAVSYVSGTMKGIFNHIRCVDYLVTRPDVDPARLGVIGHSLGGHNAIFAAAFDERLQVAVSSCGWTPFHYYYNGNPTGWSSDRYMPRIRDRFALDPNQIPFDFYECIAALAPRAFFSNSPLHDDNFDVHGVRKAEPVIAKVYELHHARDRFQIRHPDAGHDFPPEVREEAYRFIDSIIGPPVE